MTKRVSSIFLMAGVFLLITAIPAPAQVSQPEFWVTWKAKNYVPPGFEGKSLPVLGAPVEIAFNLVNQGTKINLGAQTVNWYLNDSLIGSGPGLQSISFTPLKKSVEIRITIPDYPGGSLLAKTISLPIVNPEAVISTHLVDNRISENHFTVSGYPFFFNTTSSGNLEFSWQVNGESPNDATDPENLTINISNPSEESTFSLRVGLTITNPDTTLASFISKIKESATKVVTLSSGN